MAGFPPFLSSPYPLSGWLLIGRKERPLCWSRRGLVTRKVLPSYRTVYAPHAAWCGVALCSALREILGWWTVGGVRQQYISQLVGLNRQSEGVVLWNRRQPRQPRLGNRRLLIDSLLGVWLCGVFFVRWSTKRILFVFVAWCMMRSSASIPFSFGKLLLWTVV